MKRNKFFVKISAILILLSSIISLFVYFWLTRLKIDKNNYKNNFFWLNTSQSKMNVDLPEKRDEVMYQIFPSSFADGDGDGKGDLIGVKNKIDYLKNLGINSVWFNPIFESPSNHRYDVKDDKKIDQELGGQKAFDEMMKEFKKNNIKVYLDFVPNHSSNQDPLFKKWLKHVKDNNIIWNLNDYYIPGQIDFPFIEGTTNRKKYSNNRLWHHVPGTPKAKKDLHNGQNNAYFATFHTETMPDRNFASKLTTEKLIDSAKYWLDKGVDGFRIDAVPHLFDYRYTHGEQINEYSKYGITLGKEAMHLGSTWFKYFTNKLKEYKKDVYIFGETLKGKEELAEYNKAITQFNAPLYENFFNNEIFRGENIAKNYNELNNYYKNKSGNKNFKNQISFLSSHDKDRFSSLLYEDLGKTYKEYDDNKTFMNSFKNRYVSAYGIQLTLPDQPLIYYGEEFGLIGKRDSREHDDLSRRLVMPWKDGEVLYVGNDDSKSSYVSSYGTSRKILFDENKNIVDYKKDSVFKKISSLIKFRKNNKEIWKLPFSNYEIENLGSLGKAYSYEDKKNNLLYLFITNLNINQNLNINLSSQNKKILDIQYIFGDDEINKSNIFDVLPGRTVLLKIK